MKLEDYFSYLNASDQLYEMLGIEKEEETEKCINFNEDLKKIKENLLYCKTCGFIYEKNIQDDTNKLKYKINQLGL